MKRYRPQLIEIEAKLKPFIPEMIPAVGDIDAFIKVDRPDGAVETLGLNILDEPSLQQSDPSVLDLRLRSVYKQSSTKAIVIKQMRLNY
jgi:intraflagellar transport protein 46